MRRWAVASATLAPFGLVLAAVVARLLVGNSIAYSAVAQTMSVLAAWPGSAWVMTAGFVWCGVGLVVTALGLRVRTLSRTVLIAAGVCGLVVAAAPVSSYAFSATTAVHLTAAALGAALMAAWPLTTMSRAPHTPLPFRLGVTIPVTLALLGLLGWLGYAALTGGLLGLAERATIFAEVTWPAVVALAVYWRRRRHTTAGTVPPG